MSKIKKPSCVKCKFAMVDEDGDYFCRRFPPQVSITHSRFPRVYHDEWCGEYVPMGNEDDIN